LSIGSSLGAKGFSGDPRHGGILNDSRQNRKSGLAPRPRQLSIRPVFQQDLYQPRVPHPHGVQIQVPTEQMLTAVEIETLPIESVNPLVNLMVRDVATVRQGVRPGELDRDMSQRYLTLTANGEGEDMGRASRQVERRSPPGNHPAACGWNPWASCRRWWPCSRRSASGLAPTTTR
jgi:hypothetical protein